MSEPRCVNAHDLCWQGGSCPYCEPKFTGLTIKTSAGSRLIVERDYPPLSVDLAANDGACVFSIETGEYETATPAPSDRQKGEG